MANNTVSVKPKKTVVFDFDGVIHSYTKGWQGETVIYDPPVAGVGQVITELRELGYEVIVVSTRCATTAGLAAVVEWLIKMDITVDDVRAEKPPAMCYVDDRAINFDGDPTGLIEKITHFKTWQEV